MGCETDRDRRTGLERNFLLNFWCMTVRGHTIRVQTFSHFGKQILLFEAAPCAGHTGFGVNNQIIGINQTGSDQRQKQGQGGGRIAAGTSNQPRFGNRRAIMFAQAINRLTQQVRRVMAAPISVGIDRRITQSEICRHIDNFQMFRQAGNHILRRRMGQTANHRINILPIHSLHLDQGRQVKASKLRIERTIGFAGLGIGGQRSNLDMRMTGQQAHSISTGITRCANHANFQPFIGHNALFHLSLSCRHHD